MFSGMRAMTDKGPTIRIPDSDRLTCPCCSPIASPMPTSRAPCSVGTPCSTASGCSTSRSRAATARTMSGTVGAARATEMAVVRDLLSTFAGESRTSRIVADHRRRARLLLDEFPESATDPRGLARLKASRRSRAWWRVTARKRGRRSARRCATTGASPGAPSPRRRGPAGQARAGARVPPTPWSRHLAESVSGTTRNGRAPMRFRPFVLVRSESALVDADVVHVEGVGRTASRCRAHRHPSHRPRG